MDPESLEQRASDLAREAEAATRRYDRWAWLRYVALWVPIPIVVLAFKRHLEVWHYFGLGTLFLAVGAAIYVVEVKAAARRDRAIDTAEAARLAGEAALQSSTHDDR